MDENIDDGGAITEEQQWSHETTQIHDGYKVDLNDEGQFVESLLLEWPIVAYSRVVDEDIEPSKSVCDRTGQRLAMVRRGEVARKRH